jgi:hypothetical protein
MPDIDLMSVIIKELFKNSFSAKVRRKTKC